MIQKLITDINADEAEKKRDEAESTKDYQEMVAASTASRKTKKSDITNKSAALGRMKETLNNLKKSKTDALTVMQETIQKKSATESSCTFILTAYEERKEARANEVEGLKKSMAVLAG